MNLRLSAVLGMVLICSSSARAAPVPLLVLEPRSRGPVEPNPALLPAGVSGVLATTDGEPFTVHAAPGTLPAATTAEVEQALSSVLTAGRLSAAVGSLTLVGGGVEAPRVDAAYLSEALLSGAVEPAPTWVMSDEVAAELDAVAQESADRLLQPKVLWWFDQTVDGVPIEGAGVELTTDGSSVSVLSGAVFADQTTANTRVLDQQTAEDGAVAFVNAAEGIASDAAEVVVANGADLLFAWRVAVDAPEGPHDVWVDAESGKVLQALPAFASSTGRVADPDPTAGFRVATFDVNPPAADMLVLQSSTAILVNGGGDGDNSNLSVPSVGDTFDLLPINDTANLTRVTQPGYNTLFQHVNAFAWTEITNDEFSALGSEPIPFYEVIVNDLDPCLIAFFYELDQMPDNACWQRGNVVRFGVGSLTLNAPYEYWAQSENTALDATVITHELAHGLQRQQMGFPAAPRGTINASRDEGVADYWAMTFHDTPFFGSFAGFGRAVQQGGGWPRAADSADVFPEHLESGANDGPHANGQIIANALFESRAELMQRNPIGRFVLDAHLMQALRVAGVGQSAAQTPREVYDSFHQVLIPLLSFAGNSLDAQDILVGFARAGITVSALEAIITIDRDVIDVSDPTLPEFTVWTGRDYPLPPPGSPLPPTASEVYNPIFEIELANDPAFTTNRVTSGEQPIGGVSLVGLPTAHFSPTQAQWDTLRNGGPRVYYRVTSFENYGGARINVRTSDHYNGETVELPVAFALIDSGEPSASGCQCLEEASCSSAGSRTAAGSLAALLTLALVRRRPTAAG